MKYFIELGVRARGVQLIELTEEEKNELLKVEDLDEIYLDWMYRSEYDFALEDYYLTPFVDRYSLTIRDENDNIVYDSNNVLELLDGTFDVKDWKFEGVKDGYYLTRIQTIKGCCCSGEFEIDGTFDKNKLYIVRDERIDEGLNGELVYPLFVLYYQRGEGCDMSRDVINLEFESDLGEQYFDTFLVKLRELNWWIDLHKVKE